MSEFFEAWLSQVATPKISKAVFSAYENAVRYIVGRYGRLRLSLMSEAHIVSIFKGAVECPMQEPEFVKEVLKKTLKFAKKVEYICYDPARDEMLFSAWFIGDDRLSSADDIETSEDGWPIWDCGKIINELIGSTRNLTRIRSKISIGLSLARFMIGQGSSAPSR